MLFKCDIMLWVTTVKRHIIAFRHRFNGGVDQFIWNPNHLPIHDFSPVLRHQLEGLIMGKMHADFAQYPQGGLVDRLNLFI